MKSTLFNELIQQALMSLPQTAQGLKDEVAESLSRSFQARLPELGLISRTEFDIQTRVLARTRARLDELLERLQALEGTLKSPP